MNPDQARSIDDVIERAARASTDEIIEVVRRSAMSAGAKDALILLVDYEQRSLNPLTADGETLDIDGSIGGVAYRTGKLVQIETETGWCLWAPLVDGRARLGVLRIDVAELTPDVEAWARTFADVVNLLVMARSVYGDAVERVRRNRPFDLATELRYSFLPPEAFAAGDVDVAAVLEPAYEVAGDGFDYALTDGILDVNITDAVGHGLTSSRVANLVTASLRWSRRHGLSLVDSYREASRVVDEEAGDARFVTALLGRLDVTSGGLDLLNAGHPLPLLLRGGRHPVDLACPPTLPIGVGVPPTPPRLCRWGLEPGDALLFYTDGVVEARAPDGTEFGRDRLTDFLVQAAASDELPSELLRRLVHHILAHAAAPIHDDACMVMVRWQPPPRS